MHRSQDRGPRRSGLSRRSTFRPSQMGEPQDGSVVSISLWDSREALGAGAGARPPRRSFLGRMRKAKPAPFSELVDNHGALSVTKTSSSRPNRSELPAGPRAGASARVPLQPAAGVRFLHRAVYGASERSWTCPLDRPVQLLAAFGSVRQHVQLSRAGWGARPDIMITSVRVVAKVKLTAEDLRRLGTEDGYRLTVKTAAEAAPRASNCLRRAAA